MKIVLITGASRGIGRALAEKFLANGDFVIGTSRTGSADFQNEHLVILTLELTDEVSRKAFAQSVAGYKKSIDFFINNAGLWHEDDNGPSIDLDVLRQTLEADLLGPIDVAERLLPFMAPDSHIVNVSSRRGSLAFTEERTDSPGRSATAHPSYSIAKAGLNMFTRQLAARLKGKSIVSCVHPGSVMTDMNPEGKISAQEAAADIFKLANSDIETGQFWYKGEKFPW